MWNMTLSVSFYRQMGGGRVKTVDKAIYISTLSVKVTSRWSGLLSTHLQISVFVLYGLFNSK